jgi:hypothetical protein
MRLSLASCYQQATEVQRDNQAGWNAAATRVDVILFRSHAEALEKPSGLITGDSFFIITDFLTFKM